jgi:TonB family protein
MTLPVGGTLQERSASTRIGTGVVLSDLREPVYPRLAQLARIQGDVELTVQVKKDGVVESVDVVNGLSGPPMLLESAVASARASKFECQTCDDAPQSYSLAYEFRIVASDPDQYCKAPDQLLPPKLDASRHNVTVFANEFWTCDPSVVIRRTYTRVRSASCLYLWKCGLRLESSETLN